jgi:hypothetical protein
MRECRHGSKERPQRVGTPTGTGSPVGSYGQVFSRSCRFCARHVNRGGSRNAATIAIQALLDGEAEALTRKAIELGLAGDMTGLRLCLDRIVPPRNDRYVAFPLPAMNEAADAAKSLASIVAAVGSGDLTPSEASELTKGVEGYARVLETVDHEERLKTLEGKIKDGKQPKTLSELMTSSNRQSWRNDRAALFRSGRPGLAVQVDVAADFSSDPTDRNHCSHPILGGLHHHYVRSRWRPASVKNCSGNIPANL